MAVTPSDEELLRSMQGGNAQAFETLYDRRQAGIYRYALRMSGSTAVAEDVTQEVFLALIRDSGSYDETRGTFKSYLYGMARHRLFRRLERERAMVSFNNDADDDFAPELLFESADPFAEIERDELIEMVREAVLSLPPHFREVVVLCHLQEMDYASAAAVMGCPLGTVRSRLSRARFMLCEKLKRFRDGELVKREVAKQSL